MSIQPLVANTGIHLNGTDYGVIVVYVLVLLGVGFFVSWRQRHSDDLFLASRSLGWGNVGLSIFGTNVGPAFLIASCGAGYTTGMATANYEWMAFVFLFFLGMFFVPYYLHTKVSTMPEFMRKRFGNRCYSFMSWYALFSTVVMWLGGTLFAGGALFSQLTGLELYTSIALLALIAASFTVAGGLAAVVWTDSFQSLLMIGGASALAVIGLVQVGGFGEAATIEVGSNPEMTWKLFHGNGAETPWYVYFLGYPVLGFWFWCTDQTIVQRVLGARDLKQGQAGTLFAAFLKILPPFIFLIPGIFAARLLPGIDDDKAVFTTMVATYLPHGMIGLIMAVLVAAVISTLDSGLNSFSTIFTLDIYKRHINPGASDHLLKKTGRIITVSAAVLAVGIAIFLANNKGERNLFDLFQSLIGFLAPPIAAVFLLGVFWHRATSKAAFLTLVLGTLCCISVGMLNLLEVDQLTIGGKTLVTITPWPHFLMISFYLFVFNLLLMVISSLLTRHSKEEANFPSLREAYQSNHPLGKPGWYLWGGVFALMIAIYCIFN
ncbi:MAG: sodium/solute symporter [Akkermansiaceae bacterium]|nr:sodium/solute symporter [Akkermansiaceae bacterium]